MTEIYDEPELDTAQNIRYWQRCLKTFLPTDYTSTDSTRMALGFFILAALDLLHAGADKFSPDQLKDIREWILKCQHPDGGFCGSPNHVYPKSYYESGDRQMDPATVPITYFAILSLSFVGGLKELNRQKCLNWLSKLQREDGSFGEILDDKGNVKGGKDMRYCYTAAAIRSVLQGGIDQTQMVAWKDINVQKLIEYIRASQTYDWGFSESSHHEAHAGYTYCAIAALALLGSPVTADDVPSKASQQIEGMSNTPGTISWLVSRQSIYEELADESDEDENEEVDPYLEAKMKMMGIHDNAISETLNQAVPVLSPMSNDTQWIGFNGRCNKKVDTCYSFWVGASLEILGVGQLAISAAGRRFLLQQTAHRIGGFGKVAGAPPDIYHSYLGLAALSIAGEPSLKKLDSPLCVSIEAKAKLKRAMDEIIRDTKARGAEAVPLETPEWLRNMTANWGPTWDPTNLNGTPSYLHRYMKENLVPNKQQS